MVWCQMEPPRCQKYFPASQRLLRNLCTLTTCLLHPPRSSEMQRRVQAVPGLFSGRWYTTVLCVTDVFKCSLSRTTTGIPHRRGRLNRRDSEAKQLQRFCRKQFNYHKNVFTEPVTPEVVSFHLSGLPASLAGFLAHPSFCQMTAALLGHFLQLSPLPLPLFFFSPFTFSHVTESNFNVLETLIFSSLLFLFSNFVLFCGAPHF